MKDFIEEHLSKQTVEQRIAHAKLGLKYRIEDIQRYRNEWGYMTENENGDFVKISDVLDLFKKLKDGI